MDDLEEYEEIVEDELPVEVYDENENDDDLDEDIESEMEAVLDEEDDEPNTVPKTSRKKEPVSDEEEDWLKALEEGRLHEFDEELKKMNDPKLMTARQRALLMSKTEKHNKEEITAKTASKATEEVMDKETLEKNLLKARKRRQQAEEKKEKDKKLTIERLLNKKSDSSGKGGAGVKGKKKKPEIPKISYINNHNGVYVCFPDNMIPEFEVFSNFESKPLVPKTVLCANGCGKPKKYSCSHSKLPCCSLECYRILEAK